MINHKRFEFYIIFIINTCLSTGVLSFLIEWSKINIYIGLFYLLIQFLCLFNTSEILLRSLIFLFHKKRDFNFSKDVKNQTLLINYNLKAHDKKSIDECLKNYQTSFLNNISKEYTGVLVSATEDSKLLEYEYDEFKKYRLNIYETLIRRVLKYLKTYKLYDDNVIINLDKIEDDFNYYYWRQFDFEYLRKNYEQICLNKSEEFIYLKRISKVLKKCGQYQDLISLSEGHIFGYSYKDKDIYGDLCRADEEFLFEMNPSINKIVSKKFKYTLVLDSDSKIGIGECFKMINIAEQYSEYSIIQPEIRFYNQINLFQQIQTIIQFNSNILNSYFCSYLNHSNFYGKGLIRNSNYFNKCIGDPENPIEYVPLNCISHDTFESMALSTLYCDRLSIYEEPPSSLISWNIRELRWNYGDIIVAKHIYPRLFCRTSPTYSRNIFKLDFTQLYFALSPIRILISKPLLMLFIVFSIFIPISYSYIPFLYIMFILIIIPSIINLKINTIKNSLVIITSMIFHYTPDSLLGTIRLFRIIYKLLTNNNSWISQRKIENDMEEKGIVRLSFQYFGIYSLISSIIFGFIYNQIPSLNYFLICIIILPVYCVIIDKVPYQDLPRIEIKKIKTNKFFQKKTILPIDYLRDSPKIKRIRSVIRRNRISRIFLNWFNK